MTTIYKSLKERQIRILAVVPSSSPNDLRFEFWHVSVSKPIPYTAVSYAWNHEAGNEVIYVNNQVLFIKRNLWKCLQCLRLTWRCIWADAICVNQSDVEEVNCQVGMMGQIYANAAVVSVWLGDIVQDHVSPGDVLRERQASRVPGVHNRRLVPSLASFTVDHPFATLDEDNLSHDLAQSIYDIARATYWRRAWIIQEFLLARKIHIYYGDAQIDEAIFRAVLLEQIDLKCDFPNATDLLDGSHLAEWPPLIFVAERQLRTRTQMKRPFYDLLAGHANAECWNARDIVFSLLSLIKPEERAMLDRCFPNYSVKFVDVALVALAHLKHFAGDRPLQPLLQALKIKTRLEVREKLLLFHLLGSFDYIGSLNPAAKAYRLRKEAELASDEGKKLYIDDYAHKLEQPDITLNGLYGDECSSKHKGSLTSSITEETPRVEYPARLRSKLSARLASPRLAFFRATSGPKVTLQLETTFPEPDAYSAMPEPE